MYKPHGESSGNKPPPMSAFEWKGSQSLRRVYVLRTIQN